jgi:peptidyl-prolyl cis-trans isomerase SurA
MSRLVLSIVFLLLLAPSAFSQSGDKSKSLPVFSVNKKEVSAEEFIYLYTKNNRDKKEEFTKEKIEEYLTLLINFKLKVEEARQRGLDTTAAFVKEYNGYREELRKPYLPDSKMIDSLVKLTYNRMREEVKASHILLNLKPDASPADTAKVYNRIVELRNRIVKGEDFDALAAANSEEPNAKFSKGNLGYFSAMQMVFPFEHAAFSTPVGGVSKPVRTQFGYHIIKVYDRRPSRGEVEVAHIMLRTGEGFDNDKAKNTAFDVFDQLQKGVNWNDLVKEYSQDPSSKENEGKLRPFGAGAMAGVPEFELAAFSLKNPGDYSDPVQTQFGWHILKLINKIPLPPLSEMEGALKNRVSRDERAQISRQAIQDKMKKEFGFTENATVKAKILSIADSTLMKGKWKADRKLINPSDVLFSMKTKPYTVNEFLNFAEKNQKAGAQAPQKLLEQLYTRYVETIQGELLEDQIKSKNPDYSYLLNEYYEGILLFEIMEKEVWNKASEDSVGQLKYYESHKADYSAQERVSASLYSSSNKNAIQDLKAHLEKNDSVKVKEFVAAQKIRSERGRYEKNDRPVLTKVTWSPGLYLTENNGLTYVVKIDSIVAPGVKTFDEARASIISDYQTFVEKQWITELKKKYPVKVNKKGKQYILKQLVKN